MKRRLANVIPVIAPAPDPPDPPIGRDAKNKQCRLYNTKM